MLLKTCTLATPVSEEVADAEPDRFRGCPGRGAVRYAPFENGLKVRIQEDHTTIEIEAAVAGRT